MKVEREDNGYKASEKLEKMAKVFEKAVEKVFPGSTIEYFLIGDNWLLTKVRLENHHYGNFNVCENRVSFNGRMCSMDERKAFEALTYNDELFCGRLFEIAND